MNQKKNESSYLGEMSAGARRGRRGAQLHVGEREKSRRWLLLLVDVLLLVAIVAAVFLLVVLLTPLELFAGSEVEERTVVYTVEFTNVNSELLGSLHIGDSVTDAETGSVIGVVTAISDRDSYFSEMPSSAEDEELQMHVVTKNQYPDGYKTLTVTIEAVAEYRPGVGYAAEDCRIAVGRAYNLRFPAYAGEGVCVTFETKEVAQ